MQRIIPSLDRPPHILHCNILTYSVSIEQYLTLQYSHKQYTEYLTLQYSHKKYIRNISHCNILTQSVSNKVAQVGMIIIILELIKIYCFQNNG